MKDAERTNRDTPAALDAIPERYWRNARFLSRTDQEKLLQAHVVIIGLGGLGGTVLEELLRLGIGTITGVDMDVFELSNLNRQLLATEENIGLHKAEAARLRARQINSGVRFIPVTEKQDFGSMCDLFRDADVVVDALGGLADRQALEKAAAEKGVPVVSGARPSFRERRGPRLFSPEKAIALLPTKSSATSRPRYFLRRPYRLRSCSKS